MAREDLRQHGAAHRIAVDVRLRDLEVIHQLDDVLRHLRSVLAGVVRLVALAVAARVDRDHAMARGQRLRNPGLDPLALGVGGVAVDEDHRRAARAELEVVNLRAVGRGKEAALGFLRAQRGGEHDGGGARGKQDSHLDAP